MRAVLITGVDQVGVDEVPDPVPGPGEVVVEVAAAALNHRDVWIKRGQYAGLKYPCVPGSDGAGTVVALGAGVDSAWAASQVIVNPSLDWGPDPQAQGPGFSILGLPRAGTLAEKVSVPASQLAPKPPHLSLEEAAAIPLAALTAWRAFVTRGAFRAGDKVLITGIGSGVALFALQFAVASGAAVWVTSGSEAKIARAVELGARGGFLYTDPGWAAAAAQSAGPFDLIIESAGGAGFAQVLDAAAPGGRIVFFGATLGNPPELPMRKVFWRQLSLLGTTMGSPADWLAMLQFLNRHRLKPVISEQYTLAEAERALARLDSGGQFGKIVVSINDGR